MNRVRSLSISLLATTLVFGVAACSSSSGKNQKGSAASSTGHFERDNLVDDPSMEDDSTITAEQIDRFLTNKSSGLAQVEVDGKSVGQILVEATRPKLTAEGTSVGINPLALLVKLQTEHGLVSAKGTPSDDLLARAFECACDEDATKTCKLSGFAVQAKCAATTLRNAMSKQKAGKSTISGWLVKQENTTQDGVSITPETRATAALYTYTPYVGGKGGGNMPKVGGAYAYWEVWTQYASALHYKSVDDATSNAPAKCTPSTTKGSSSSSSGSTTTDGACSAETGGTRCLPNGVCGCNTDRDCGDTRSGRICDVAHRCVPGCHGIGGNKCPSGQTCSSNGDAIGSCSGSTASQDCTETDTSACSASRSGDACIAGRCGCTDDSNCGGDGSGRICQAGACVEGCRGSRSCPSGTQCDASGSVGKCVQNTNATCDEAQCATSPKGHVCVVDSASNRCGCRVDSDCGESDSGRICDAYTQRCAEGCHTNGNGCPRGESCESGGGSVGQCVARTDPDPGPWSGTGASNSDNGDTGGSTTTTTTTGDSNDSTDTGSGYTPSDTGGSTGGTPSGSKKPSGSKASTPSEETNAPSTDDSKKGGCSAAPAGNSDESATGALLLLSAGIFAARRRRARD